MNRAAFIDQTTGIRVCGEHPKMEMDVNELRISGVPYKDIANRLGITLTEVIKLNARYKRRAENNKMIRLGLSFPKGSGPKRRMF